MKKPATVDEYLEGVAEPARTTLAAMRAMMRELVPDAVELISYGMPGYKLNGDAVGGFAAFKEHCSYFPHSGTTLAGFPEEMAKYGGTKSGLHFALDKPLPKALVKKLVKARMAESEERKAAKSARGKGARKPPAD